MSVALLDLDSMRLTSRTVRDPVPLFEPDSLWCLVSAALEMNEPSWPEIKQPRNAERSEVTDAHELAHRFAVGSKARHLAVDQHET